LKLNNLSNYYDKFLENGIDDMEIVKDLQKEHLDQLDIPLGHQIKLLKSIG
jgi:hypothetical protein